MKTVSKAFFRYLPRRKGLAILQLLGIAFGVAAAVGMALYPEHGRQADVLLQRASAQAGTVATLGRAGFAAATQRGGGTAANDDN